MNRLEAISSQIARPKVTLQNLKTLQVSVSMGGQVGTVWFKREEFLNSISYRMVWEFEFLFSYLDALPSVKVILIRSKHPKIFSSGADIKDIFFETDTPVNLNRVFDLGAILRAVRKPTVSVVEGVAFGGGFEYSLISDFIFCSDKATFRLPEIDLGLIPGMGGTQYLARLASSHLSSRFVMTSELLTGPKAMELGIATCVPAAQFEQRLVEFLEVLLSKPLEGLMAAKAAVIFAQGSSLEQGLLFESQLFQGLFKKPQARQGLQAFIEQRKPNFHSLS